MESNAAAAGASTTQMMTNLLRAIVRTAERGICLMGDTHDRLIARLEELRERDFNLTREGVLPECRASLHEHFSDLIDIAIYAVQARCPNCSDTVAWSGRRPWAS